MRVNEGLESVIGIERFSLCDPCYFSSPPRIYTGKRYIAKMKFEVEMHEYWMEGMVSKKRFRANGSAIGSFELDRGRDISVGNYCERKWNGESIARYSAGQAKSMPDRVLVNLISLLDLL